jgi:hypothetical protein
VVIWRPRYALVDIMSLIGHPDRLRFETGELHPQVLMVGVTLVKFCMVGNVTRREVDHGEKPASAGGYE